MKHTVTLFGPTMRVVMVEKKSFWFVLFGWDWKS